MKLLICLLLSLPLLTWGQEKSKETSTNKDNLSKNLLLGYHGEQIFHPGLSFSVENPFLQRVKSKSKPRLLKKDKVKDKVKTNEYAWSYGGGFFAHRNNNMYFMTNAKVQYRLSKSNGVFRGFGFGVGLNRSLHLNPTYEIVNDALQRKSLAGDFYFSIPMHFEKGYDFEKLLKIPSKVYSRFGVNTLLGYNAGILPQLSLEIGLITKLN